MHRKSRLNSFKGKLISKCVKCIISFLNEKLTYILFIALIIENVSKSCHKKDTYFVFDRNEDRNA